MGLDLGARLVRAGLVSRVQLAEALEHAKSPSGGALALALLDRGLSEDTLVGMLAAEGYGPVVPLEALGAASPRLIARLPQDMAASLAALPVQATPSGVVVAMVDPSDAHAIREIEFALSEVVVPRVSYARALEQAIERHYGGLRPPSAGRRARTDETRPVPPDSPWIDDADEVTERGAGENVVLAAPHVGAARIPPEVPSLVSGSSASRGVKAAARRASGAFPVEITSSYELPEGSIPSPPAESRPPARARRPTPLVPLHQGDDRWQPPDVQSPGMEPPVQTRPPAPAQRGRRSVTRPSLAPAPLGTILAEIRAARDADTVARLLCEAGSVVARAVVLLRHRRRLLEGWEARGGGITRDSVINVRIPVGTPSVFRNVVETGTPYFGPHGSSAADALFRVAVGSHAGLLFVQPIAVRGRIVAVCCADELFYGSVGRERIEVLTQACSEAFGSIIHQRKLE